MSFHQRPKRDDASRRRKREPAQGLGLGRAPLPGLILMACTFLAAMPASALEVGDCEVQVGEGVLTCLLTNGDDEPVAELDYEVVVTEDGRSVPWGRGAGRVPVYGGIEPGETVEFSFPVEGLPPAALGRDLSWDFARLRGRGLDGRRIGSDSAEERSAADEPSTDPQEPRASAEADPRPDLQDVSALGAAILACWDPATLPGDAQRVPVTLGFALDEDGRLSDDIRVLSGSLGEDPAFDRAAAAAIGAVEACQEGGFPPPPEGAATWDWVVLTFDPMEGGIR
jgi:hypothetical protein